MHVPITKTELEALVSAARNQTIPLTHSTDTRTNSGFAIDEDAVGASWALATLANLRLRTEPVNEPGDRGLTDQEVDRLRTIISSALAQRLDTEAARIGAITSAVRAWLDTLT